MNLRDIKTRAAQSGKDLKKVFGQLNQATLAKLDDIRKSSVTQEKPLANKVLTDYRQLTSLTVAGVLVLTSGIFAYQGVAFDGIEAEMAFNAPVVKEQGKTIDSVIPTEVLSENQAALPVLGSSQPVRHTIIEDRTITKGAQPFILSTALEQVELYSELAFDGYALSVNGKEVGFFSKESEAITTLDTFKKTYLTNAKIEESYFKETVATQMTRREAAFFKGFEKTADVLNFIAKGTDVEKVHTVADGESFWAISTKYGISVDNLIKANPKVVPERIKAGDKISLLVAQPLITLCTVETVTYSEAIPYTIRYKDDSVLYKGQAKVTVKGNAGEKSIVAKLVKENGVAVKRLVLSEKIVSAPKEQVVAKGIKKAPSTAATGKLAKPYSRGSFSSGFGRRWGRMHEGVDWSMPVGSPVYAADGGVIVSAGYDGAYGICIIVNHGNGLKTRYAHLSKSLVKVGSHVFKGQKIANSGNTGRSTGAHLHFEVIKNGVVVNPLKYIK